MEWLNELGRRVLMLLRRNQLDRDLKEEMRLHMQLRAEQHAERGAPPDEAQTAARRQFGNPTLLHEQSHDAWGWRWLESLSQDARYGVRLLLRSPGFALVAVVILALGIGANTAIFSVVYGLLLRPLPYPDAEKIAVVYMHFSPQNMDRGPFSMADFLDFRASSRGFQEIGAYAPNRFDMTGDGPAEQLLGASVTPEFFSIFGITPRQGRVFEPGDSSPTAARVAIIGENLWRRRFRADPGVVGRAIRLGGNLYTVVGVMPNSFRLSTPEAEVWTNLPLSPPTRRGPFFLNAVAKLAPGFTWEQATADAGNVAHSIEAANSSQYSHLSFVVLPLRDALVGDTRLSLLVLLAAVGCVLLIATANVANLLMARGAARRREIALRLCLGATRFRLLKQLLVESLLLATLGGGAGCLLAFLAVHAMQGWSAPSYVPRLDGIGLDAPVLAFTATLSLATGLIFGMMPALAHSQLSLVPALKEGERGGSRSADSTLRSALVVFEVALSVVLLAGAGLFLRSLLRLKSVDLGISAPVEKTLLVRVSIPPAAPGDNKYYAGARLFDQMLQRVRQLPGVTGAALTDARVPDYWANSDTFQIEGEPWNEQAFPSTPLPDVSDGYFETLGIPLLKGRTFNEHDTPDAPVVAVISANLAHRYFPGVDPIGRYLRESGPGTPNSRRVQIVGVVADVPYDGPQRAAEPVFYEPLAQSVYPRVFLVVRSALDPHALAPTITRELQALDPNVVVGRAVTLDESLSEALTQPRFLAQLTGGFALLALILASVGLYGVISYLVGQRTHEIGIRVALGAKPTDVLAMVLRRGIELAALGVAIGTVIAFAVTRIAGKLLFGIKPTDPATFAFVTFILVIVAVVASYIPARRATHIDPMIALRYE